MERKLLEQVIHSLMNDDTQKAEKLFNSYLLETAKKIHSEILENDEEYSTIVNESMYENQEEEVSVDEFFKSIEENDDELTIDESDENLNDVIEADEDNNDMSGDISNDMDSFKPDETDEQTMQQEIDDLKAEIERLMNDDTSNDTSNDDSIEPSVDDQENTSNGTDMELIDDTDEKEHVKEEEVDDLVESLIDELSKVDVSMAENHLVGDGGTTKVNSESLISGKKVNSTPKAVKIDTTNDSLNEKPKMLPTKKIGPSQIGSQQPKKIGEKGDPSAMLHKTEKSTTSRSPIAGK